MVLIALVCLAVLGLVIDPIELRIGKVLDEHVVFEEMPYRKRWMKAAKNGWIVCGSVVWEAVLANPKLAEDCWFCSKKEEFWEMFMFGCFSVAFISVLLIILSLVGVWVPFGFGEWSSFVVWIYASCIFLFKMIRVEFLLLLSVKGSWNGSRHLDCFGEDDYSSDLVVPVPWLFKCFITARMICFPLQVGPELISVWPLPCDEITLKPT